MKKLISAIAVWFCLIPSANAKDIVDTAVSAGSFKTLAAALQAAGLERFSGGPALASRFPSP